MSTVIQNALVGLSLLVAHAHLGLILVELSSPRLERLQVWTKPLPAALLALVVLFAPVRLKAHHRPLSVVVRLLRILALASSALGDYFLLFAKTRPDYFVLGLASFAVAHISYTLDLLRISRRFSVRSFAFVSSFSSLMLFLIVPRLPQDLVFPVLVYCALISLMTDRALCAVPFSLSRGLGAIFFMFSDSALALGKFVFVAHEYSPDFYRKLTLFVMASYYAAQFLLNSDVFGFGTAPGLATEPSGAAFAPTDRLHHQPHDRQQQQHSKQQQQHHHHHHDGTRGGHAAADGSHKTD